MDFDEFCAWVTITGTLNVFSAAVAPTLATNITFTFCTWSQIATALTDNMTLWNSVHNNVYSVAQFQ